MIPAFEFSAPSRDYSEISQYLHNALSVSNRFWDISFAGYHLKFERLAFCIVDIRLHVHTNFAELYHPFACCSRRRQCCIDSAAIWKYCRKLRAIPFRSGESRPCLLKVRKGSQTIIRHQKIQILLNCRSIPAASARMRES